VSDEYTDPRARRFVRRGDAATQSEVAVVAPDVVESPERRFTRRGIDGPPSTPSEPGIPEGRLARRLTAVVEAAYGNPTPHEAAAIAAAVQTILDAEARAAAPDVPEAYRSGWRRAAIHEAVRRMDVS
jgi:hypothetical protein